MFPIHKEKLSKQKHKYLMFHKDKMGQQKYRQLIYFNKVTQLRLFKMIVFKMQMVTKLGTKQVL